jgi:hypothetical protein
MLVYILDLFLCRWTAQYGPSEGAAALEYLKHAMKHCNLDFLGSSTVVKKHVAPDYWNIKSTQHFSISSIL